MLCLLLACGLRRHEVVMLRVDDLQRREDHWAIVDLVGKGRHVWTVPIPDWVRRELDNWLTSAGIERGKIFRRVSEMGKVSALGMTTKVVWHIVKDAARRAGIANLAPHDLRRYAECRIMPNHSNRVAAVSVNLMAMRHNLDILTRPAILEGMKTIIDSKLLERLRVGPLSPFLDIYLTRVGQEGY